MSNCCRVVNVMMHITDEQINIEEFWAAVKPNNTDPGWLEHRPTDEELEAWNDLFYPYWFLQQERTVIRSGNDLWISFEGVRSTYCFRDLGATINWIGKFMKEKYEWPTTVVDEDAGGVDRVWFVFDPYGVKDPIRYE